MAHIERLQVPTPPAIPVVALKLTSEEAQLLSDLLASVGGIGENRKMIDEMFSALEGAGFPYRDEVVGKLFVGDITVKDVK